MPDTSIDYVGVFEAIPMPATLIDADGIVLDVNQAFLEYARDLGLDIAREDRVGRSIEAPARDDNTRGRILAFSRRALSAESPIRQREQFADAAGHLTYVDLHGRPLRDSAGLVVGAIILRDDITAQVREERLAEVVSHLRDEIEAMRSSGEIERLLVAVRDGLTGLDILFANCGVNVIDGSSDPPVVQYHTMTGDGYWLDTDQDDPGNELIVGLWRGAEVAYRPDLSSEDPHGEGPLFEASFGEAIRSVVDVPFSHGTLAVNSTLPNAFTPADIDAFAALADVLTSGFGRLEDFRRLEERNRELLGQVHQRREAEIALRDSEQRYRGLVENLPVGVSHTLPGGNVVYQNPAALDIHGYDLDELRGMSARDLYVDPDDRDDLLQNLDAKGSHTYEVRLRHRAGHAVWTRNTSTVVRDQDGEILYFLAISEDITEERRQQLHRQAVQRLRDEVWRMEHESDIEHVISTVRSSLELMGVQVEGCSIHVVDDSTEPPTVNSYRSRAGETTWEAGINRVAADNIVANWRSGEPIYRPDLDLDDPLGETRYINQIYGTHIRSILDVPFSRGNVGINSSRPDAFGERDIEALVALADVLSEGFRRTEDLHVLERRLQDLEREITERRQLESQLRQAQKMEAVGQLTAGLAHNFNNMLQGIVGNVSLALMQATGEMHEILADANQSAERAADMIRHLLVFSRQGVQPELRPVDMATVTAEALDMARRTFDRRIAIHGGESDLPGEVMGDAGQLEQVVLNLLINARDALEETLDEPAIHLLLEAVDLAPSAATHPDARPGQYIAVRVSDNGVGMDSGTRERVFEPFFTTKEVDKGTGLGLSTVYGIVQQHGGWIECDTAPGQGSTFSVYLPHAAARVSGGGAPGSGGEPRGTETILVIDDEDIVRRTASRLLQHYGYTVLLAHDGPRGIELFAQHQPEIDLVLLDLSMPVMTGREVLQHLRALSSDTRIAFFTGYAAESEGESADVATVIQKPFTSLQLAETVRAVLDA